MAEKRTFLVTGMHCAGCAAAVEKAVKRLPGAEDVYVNFASGKLNFVSAGNVPDDEAVIEAVAKAGFRAALPPPDLAPVREPGLPDGCVDFSVALCFSILLLLCCMTGVPSSPDHPLLNAWCQLFLLIPVLIGGRGFFLRGLPALFRGVPNMDSLISCGALTGTLYSIALMASGAPGHLYFDAAAMILTLIMLGKLLEARARRSASSAIRRLLELTPPVAHLVREGREVDVPSAQLCPGDTVRIKPGEKIPADAEVMSGSGFVNESMLTGEEAPVSKAPGDALCGGTLNVDGTLLAEVRSTGEKSMLGQIVRLIGEAQDSRAPAAALADRAAGVFVWVIFGAALVTALIWGIVGGAQEALHFSLSVLVVACPCALGLATPVALISGIGRGAEFGILIRNGSALETAAGLRAVVLDKTGTLTSGVPRVRAVFAADGVDERVFLRAASALERFSSHPLAGAVVAEAERRGIVPEREPEHFTTIPGQGIAADWEGEPWLFGNERLMRRYGVEVPEIPASAAGSTLIFGARSCRFAGFIALGDTPRREAAAALAALEKLGLRRYMLTGDNRFAAGRCAGALRLDGFRAELLPAEKVAALREIRETVGGAVGMVGDGINDAPVLSAADLGIAVGSGSGIALESADVVLLRSDLREVPRMVMLSRATFRIIRENLFWAFFYNVCGIPLAGGIVFALGGPMLDPAFCAGAMAASSLTVVLNALRLKRFSPKIGEI